MVRIFSGSLNSGCSKKIHETLEEKIIGNVVLSGCFNARRDLRQEVCYILTRKSCDFSGNLLHFLCFASCKVEYQDNG